MEETSGEKSISCPLASGAPQEGGGAAMKASSLPRHSSLSVLYTVFSNASVVPAAAKSSGVNDFVVDCVYRLARVYTDDLNLWSFCVCSLFLILCPHSLECTHTYTHTNKQNLTKNQNLPASDRQVRLPRPGHAQLETECLHLRLCRRRGDFPFPARLHRDVG